jgi:hypothetical protein
LDLRGKKNNDTNLIVNFNDKNKTLDGGERSRIRNNW